MRTLHGMLAIAICSLGLAACAVDDDKSTDPSTESTDTTATAPPDVVTIPQELRLRATPDQGTVSGNTFDAIQPDACHVELVYCADPRWSPHYPSYCQNGCNANTAFADAISICKDVCGNINCDTMYVLGGC